MYGPASQQGILSEERDSTSRGRAVADTTAPRGACQPRSRAFRPAQQKKSRPPKGAASRNASSPSQTRFLSSSTSPLKIHTLTPITP